jgi:acyl carrier protein
MPETSAHPSGHAMNIRERVINLVEDRLSTGERFALQDSDSFLMNGLADSLKLTALVESLEREFDIVVEPGEFSPDNLDSVAGIIAYLAGKGVTD